MQSALGAGDRIPAGWNLPRERRPDTQVKPEAGFEVLERREFAVEHRWTPPELAGHVRSTSFLPAPALGDQGAAFDADLEASLSPYSRDGAFTQSVNYAYDLARKTGEAVVVIGLTSSQRAVVSTKTAWVALEFTVPIACSWIFGDSVAYRRAHSAWLEERARRAEAERDTKARLAAAAERSRIARCRDRAAIHGSS